MFRRAASALCLSLLLLAPALAQNRPTYTVGTMKEFLQKLGPDRTIVLKKGDYQLWTAYDQSGPAFSWLDGDNGKELMIEDGNNLTIRGQDGARLVTNSPTDYLLGAYSAGKMEFENLVFARQSAPEDAVEAGLFYAENVDDLSLSRCSFSGPSGYPLELWECGTIRLKDLKLEGGVYGALSVGNVANLTFTKGSVSKNSGYPLIYVEAASAVTFDGTRFEGNEGESLVEIYPSEDGDYAVLFSKCAFTGNQFSWFSGNPDIPETAGCSFKDNSFGEDWADAAVNYESSSEGDYGPDLSYHTDDYSGLTFAYPSHWEYQEGDEPGQVVVFSTDDDSLVFFARALEADPSLKLSPAKLVDKAAQALAAKLLEQGNMTLDIESSVPLDEWEGYSMAEYAGTLSQDSGDTAAVRVRFVLIDGEVYALMGIAVEEYLLEDGEALGEVILSLTNQ